MTRFCDDIKGNVGSCRCLVSVVCVCLCVRERVYLALFDKRGTVLNTFVIFSSRLVKEDVLTLRKCCLTTFGGQIKYYKTCFFLFSSLFLFLVQFAIFLVFVILSRDKKKKVWSK